MRIQKLVIISLVVGSSLSVAFSQTATQAEDQLVEILRKKQAELDAQDASRQLSPGVGPVKNKTIVVKEKQPQPPSAIVTKPAPVITERAPKSPVVPTVKPTPRNVATDSQKVISQPAVDSTAESQLVEILRKKQTELDAKEGSAPSAPLTAKTVEVKKPTIAAKPSAKEQEDSAERIKRIEAELKAKEDALKKVVATPAPVQKVEVVKPVAAVKAEPKTETKVQVSAPAPDLLTKEARLVDLLRKYKADQITPHDYHLQRAKIVAEP